MIEVLDWRSVQLHAAAVMYPVCSLDEILKTFPETGVIWMSARVLKPVQSFHYYTPIPLERQAFEPCIDYNLHIFPPLFNMKEMMLVGFQLFGAQNSSLPLLVLK